MTAPGVGGRPAKPTALKLLHGETRPSQVNYDEPKPGQAAVEPPEDISMDALDVWNSLAPDLIRVGVLTAWDAPNFREWCDAVVSAREAQHELDEDGEVISNPIIDRQGNLVGYRQIINPWWKVRREASSAMLALGARFGLTPADRARLSVGESNPKGKNAQDDSDLLSG
jgi:P27 family predicted phage terminase small subunit